MARLQQCTHRYACAYKAEKYGVRQDVGEQAHTNCQTGDVIYRQDQ